MSRSSLFFVPRQFELVSDWKWWEGKARYIATVNEWSKRDTKFRIYPRVLVLLLAVCVMRDVFKA